MDIRSRAPRVLILAAIVLIVAACGGGAPTPTAPRRATEVHTPTITSGPPGPTEVLGAGIELPPKSAAFPFDLVPMGPENIDELVPVQWLSSEDLPASISSASLAFLPYNHELAAYLDDGQLILWSMSGGRVVVAERIVHQPRRPGFRAVLEVLTGLTAQVALSAGPALEPHESFAVISESDFAEAMIKLQDVDPPGGEDEGIRVIDLAASPDGSLLATAVGPWDGKRGSVKIWSVEGQEILREIDFEESVTAVAFTSDGSGLVCAVGEDLITVDPETGILLRRKSFEFELSGFEISPQGEITATWGDRTALVEYPGPEETLAIQAQDQFRRVLFTPGDPMVAVLDGELLRFWDLSSRRELASFRGPADFVEVAVLSNGRALATIDQESKVLLWGVRGGFELSQSLPQIGGANAPALERTAELFVPNGYTVRFSEEGDLLAIGSQDGLQLVNWPTLEPGRFFPASSSWSTSFDFSADDRLFAWIVQDDLIRVRDLDRDVLIQEISPGDGVDFRSVEFIPGDEYLVTLDRGIAQVWEVANGEEVFHREGVELVHVSPDGSHLGLQLRSELAVAIWDWRNNRRVRVLSGYSTAAPFYTTSFSPDWETMYWVARVGMQFSDVDSGELGPSALFSWGKYAPGGDRVAAVEDGWTLDTVGEVHMLDVDTAESLVVFDHYEDAIVDALDFSPDGRLLATATELTVKVWDARTGEELFTVQQEDDPVNGVAFSPDGRVLLMRRGDVVTELWAVSGEVDTASREDSGPAVSVSETQSLSIGEAVTAVEFSPEGSTLAVGSASGVLRYWDQARDELVPALPSHSDWIYELDYGPPRFELASVSRDGTVFLWTPGGGPGGPSQMLQAQHGEVSAVAFMPQGEWIATSGENGVVSFWDVPGLRHLKDVQAHSAWVWDLAIAPFGDPLASASADGTVKLWRIISGARGSTPEVTPAGTLSGHTSAVWALDFNPDGSRLASASWDGTVRIWHPTVNKEMAVLEGHNDWVYDVVFSPDGKVLASASADGTVRLWDVIDKELILTLDGPGGRVWSVDFSPDGRRLVAGSDSGGVQVWEITR